MKHQSIERIQTVNMSDNESDLASDIEGAEEIVRLQESSSDESGDEDGDDWILRKIEGLKWSKKKKSSRTKMKDIVSPPNVMFDESDTIIGCFNHFMNDEVKEIILRYTNKKGMEDAAQKEKEFEPFDYIELEAYLSILLAGGVTRQSKVPFNDLWSDRGVVPDFFKCVMSRDRAREMKKYLRFDDKDTRDERRKEDKLAAVREIVDTIQKLFHESFLPNDCLTVDERMSPFKGRVSFKTYMPNKPTKFGIKIWMLVDAENYYTSNFKIYCGKEGEQKEMNQGESVVLYLTSHLGSGYEITTDNFFTSIPLMMKLLNRSNPITLLGTLRSNRKFIPDIIKKHSKNEQFSSKFAFAKDICIVSYVYKKNKTVLVASSSQHDDEITKGEKRKPKIIIDYNHTKIGVDKLDEMTKSMSTIRGSRRWTTNIFCNLLDMICVNSFVCYTVANNLKMERREFMISLYETLGKTNTSRRLTSVPPPPSVITSAIYKVYPDLKPEPIASGSKEKPKKNTKCAFCKGPSRQKNLATKYCHDCKKGVCKECFIVKCNLCINH